MNGEFKIRDQFKKALGTDFKRAFLYGTTFADAHRFFTYIARQHRTKDKSTIKFAFKKCGGNKKWSVDMVHKQLRRRGKYVFFGVSRSTCKSHQDQLAKLKNIAKVELKKHKKVAEVEGRTLDMEVVQKVIDQQVLDQWAKAKMLISDHAVSVVVDDKFNGVIYDNGCTYGDKALTVLNLAERMRTLTECFVVELYRE